MWLTYLVFFPVLLKYPDQTNNQQVIALLIRIYSLNNRVIRDMKKSPSQEEVLKWFSQPKANLLDISQPQLRMLWVHLRVRVRAATAVMKVSRKRNLRISICSVVINRNGRNMKRSITRFGSWTAIHKSNIVIVSEYLFSSWIYICPQRRAPWGKILLVNMIYSFGIDITASILQVSCHQVNRFYKGEMVFMWVTAIERT